MPEVHWYSKLTTRWQVCTPLNLEPPPCFWLEEMRRPKRNPRDFTGFRIRDEIPLACNTGPFSKTWFWTHSLFLQLSDQRTCYSQHRPLLLKKVTEPDPKLASALQLVNLKLRLTSQVLLDAQQPFGGQYLFSHPVNFRHLCMLSLTQALAQTEH